MKVFDAVWQFTDTVLEFLFWRDDWNKTWSPVSFWLAVVTGLALLIALFFYGRAAWEQVVKLVGTGG